MSLSRFHRNLLVFSAACAGGFLLGMVIRPALPSQPSRSASLSKAVSAIQQQSSTSILTDRTSPSSKIVKELTKLPASRRTLWLATQSETATPDQFARLLTLAKKEGHLDIDLARAIAAKWADLDPTHMMQHLIRNGETDYRIWKVLCVQWAQSDPEGALDQFVLANESEGIEEWNSLLWKYLMRHAPEVGIKATDQLAQNRSPDLESIRAWASKNPKQAAETVLKHMNNRRAQGQMMKEIGKAWGASDPEAALAYAQSIPSTEVRLQLAENVMQSWAMSDPEAAAEHTAATENPIERAMLSKGIAAGLAKTNPQAALTWAQDNLRSSARARAVGEIVGSVAEHNVPAAADLVAKMDPGGAMNHAVTELIGKWVNSDPTKNGDMFAWIERLADAEARERAVQGLEWHFSFYGKDGLINFVAGDHGHLATGNMLRRAAIQRTHQDPESAVAWAEALPADRANEARTAVIEAWRKIDSQAVAHWESE